MNGASGSDFLQNGERGGIIAKLILLIVLVVLLALIYLVRAPLLRLAGNFWVESDPPATSDVIVVLSDDDFTADRATRAADLYHDGWAPRVVGSGRWLRPYTSIADLMQRDLEARGVPRQAIIPFAHDAPDTLEELKGIRGFVEQHGWKRVMIVTSNYHTRRTHYLCEHVFPADVRVLVEAAPDHDYDPDSWWRTRVGVKTFFHEFVGMFVAFWEVHHQGLSSQAELVAGPGVGRSFRVISPGFMLGLHLPGPVI
ncbi:MAG: YdcF family protein [Candidatus Acidiferrales bacterium]